MMGTGVRGDGGIAAKDEKFKTVVRSTMTHGLVVFCVIFVIKK